MNILHDREDYWNEKKALRLGAALLAAVFFVTAAFGDGNLPFFAYAAEEDISATDWMAALPDSTYLSDLSIPGTHDSATANTESVIIIGTTYIKCQSLYIDEQLNAGVRYFDIRTMLEGDTLVLHHGGYKCKDRSGSTLKLDAVMNWFDTFLTNHPGETVILQLPKAGDMEGSNTPQATYDYFKNLAETTDRIYVGDHVPTLGEARRKMREQ